MCIFVQIICEIIFLVGGPWKMVAIFCVNPDIQKRLIHARY